MASSRQRSSSARSNGSDFNSRQTGTPPPSQRSNTPGTVPDDLILNDVPNYNVANASSALQIPSYGTGSPYPSIAPGMHSYSSVNVQSGQRQRAATSESSSGSQPLYRPGVRPPGPMPAPYVQGQRHASAAHVLDAARPPQYVPSMTPLNSPGPQPHMMSIPPPPPRPPPAPGPAMVLPPPPGPPPGPPPLQFGGIPSGVPHNWPYPWRPQGIPPPPPFPNPMSQGQTSHMPYNPGQQQFRGHLASPPPAPNTAWQNESSPLASTLHGPSGDLSGVGGAAADLYSSSPGPIERSTSRQGGTEMISKRSSSGQLNDIVESIGLEGAGDRSTHDIFPPPLMRHHHVATNRDHHDPNFNGHRNSTQDMLPPNYSLTGTVAGNHHHSNSNPSNSPSPHDPSEQWPLDRVLLWLAANGFSNDWQEAFKNLNLQGAGFLEIGQGGQGGKGNFSMLYQTVYPQLAKECSKSGTGWDQAREREEGKRMRRLIRRIVDNGNSGNGKPTAARRESYQQALSAASIENATEISPSLTMSATALDGDESPGSGTQIAKRSPGFSLGNRRFSNNRSSTLPMYGNSLAVTSQPNVSDHGQYKAGPGSKKHSPATSSETGASGPYSANFRPESLRPSHDSSPQSGSPNPGNASPALSGGVISAPYARYGHHKSNSTDSVAILSSTPGSAHPGTSTGLRGPETGFAAKSQDPRRNAQDAPRAIPLESSGRQTSNDGSTSATKEHRGIFGKFRKKKRDESAHPSPEEHNLDSPTSPVSFRHNPDPTNTYLPFARSAVNASDTSLDQYSTKSAHSEPPDKHTFAGRGGTVTRANFSRRWAFVTLDGLNFRLVDVTEAVSAEAVRKVICHSVGIADADHTQIFSTEPGQTEHDDALTDQSLAQIRRKAEPQGIIKFFLKGPQLSAAPGSHGSTYGTNHEITATSPHPLSAVPSRKPVDEHAFTHAFSSTSDGGKENDVSGRSGTIKAVKPLTGPVPRMPAEGLHGDRSPYPGDAALDIEDKRLSKGSLLEAAAEDHRREVERKQKAYLSSKQQKFHGESPIDSSSYGFRREGIIDFDQPRNSPFEDKRTDTWVPLRKPPPAPAESSTLIKANSLSKKSGERVRQSLGGPGDSPNRRSVGDFPIMKDRKDSPYDRSPSSSIASALLSAGRMTAGIVGIPGEPISATSPNRPTNLSPSNDSIPRRALTSIDLGTKSSPRGSPGSPGSFTRGKGDTVFKVPDYEEISPATSAGRKPSLTLAMPQNANVSQLRSESKSAGALSPGVSPSSEYPVSSGGVSQISNAQEFVEPEVSFARPQEIRQTPKDDDSEDGLFAIPLKPNETVEPPPGHEDSDDDLFAIPLRPSDKKSTDLERVDPITERVADESEKTVRPSLTLKTERAKKDLTVAFQSPHLSATEAGDTPGSSYQLDSGDATSVGDSKTERPVPASASSANWSAQSSEDNSKLLRRESFARDDIWANRPPPEALIDHLDDFFPNLDLDQPILEEQQASPPSSPGGILDHAMDAEPSGFRLSRPPDLPFFDSPNLSTSSLAAIDDYEPLGSESSGLQRNAPGVKSVAQRNMRRSGGLGRMKSIREVAKGAHQTTRKITVATSGQKANDIIRRKSTKMFGANIVQIKPTRGSRIGRVDPVPPDKVPKRQATFKWFKGQLIGKGTYGRVYLGMNATTGEFLAVKQVEVNRKAAGQDQDRMKEMVAALNQEIETMQHLDHVNIVQYLGFERKEMEISIFLEYISGGSVGSCLRKHGKFEESVVRSLTRQTLEGLAYLHGEGILHRDLKADNILLDLDGTCKISDFGISKKTDNIYGNDATNSMQGSVFWMAPEVIRSQGHGYSAKVDIWSLGCVVLEMFGGRRPWSTEETIGAIYKLGSLNQAPPIPDDVSANISPWAVAFMADCFQIDPAERPTAETLLNQHPFCRHDPTYNFFDTELYTKIRGSY